MSNNGEIILGKTIVQELCSNIFSLNVSVLPSKRVAGESGRR